MSQKVWRIAVDAPAYRVAAVPFETAPHSHLGAI